MGASRTRCFPVLRRGSVDRWRWFLSSDHDAPTHRRCPQRYRPSLRFDRAHSWRPSSLSYTFLMPYSISGDLATSEPLAANDGKGRENRVSKKPFVPLPHIQPYNAQQSLTTSVKVQQVQQSSTKSAYSRQCLFRLQGARKCVQQTRHNAGLVGLRCVNDNNNK
jgi:hypothetical protein